MLEFLLRDTDTGIGDRQSDKRLPPYIHGTGFNPHLAVRGEFGSIGDEIKHYLANLGQVGVHAAEILFDLYIEQVVIFLDQRGHR